LKGKKPENLYSNKSNTVLKLTNYTSPNCSGIKFFLFNSTLL